MSAQTCDRCGTLLLASDDGRCPYCPPPLPTHDIASDGVYAEGPSEQPVVLVPVESERFGAVDETLYQDARAILLNPVAAKARPSLVLGLTLVLFVLSARGGNSVRSLVILVSVLFFHELGHWLGMRIFGYRDVKMFFIPFFGAAVSGKHQGAAQWKQAIVLLLGPLPGIVVGCFLLFWNLALRQPLVREVGVWLVAINAFNLLPFVPLDGGRLLNIVIFSRNQKLEAVFLVLAALGVMGLGMLLGAWILAFIGFVGLFMVPMQYRVARSAAAIQQSWPGLPARLSDATDPQLRALFVSARKFTQAKAQNVAKICANLMTSIHERAIIRPVGVLASLGLLAAYATGFVISMASVVAFALQVTPPAAH